MKQEKHQYLTWDEKGIKTLIDLHRGDLEAITYDDLGEEVTVREAIHQIVEFMAKKKARRV